MIFLLAAATLAVVRIDEPIQRTAYDRVVAIELTRAHPVLEGHGPCKRVEYVAEFSGTLHIWTRVHADLDTFVRVQDADGTLVQEDDDSGGGKTPYVRLDVEPGRRLQVFAALSKDARADAADQSPLEIELCVIAAPETAATRGTSARAMSDMVEVKKLREAKNVDAAREYAARVLDDLLGVAGADVSELVAARAWELGWELSRLSLLKPAEQAWTRNWRHCVRTLPNDHYGLQLARESVARMRKFLGDDEGSLSLFEQVLDSRSRTLPDDHRDLQRARVSLADFMGERGDLQGARVLLEKVLHVFARTLPDDHSDVQTTRQGLARTLYGLGELSAARTLAERVYAVRARTRPDDDQELQWARGMFAATLQAMGDFARARELKEKALEVASRTLPDEHPDLQRARMQLAVTLAELGETEAARDLSEKVVQVMSRTQPDDHRDLQIARLNLALALTSLGDLARARALEEHVLDVYSRTLPDEDLELQRARQCLAWSLWKLGDLAGARALQSQVLHGLSRTLPDDHPRLQSLRGDLIFTLASACATTRGDDDALRQELARLSSAYIHAQVPRAREALLSGSAREAEERCANLLPDLGRACSLADGLGVIPPDSSLEPAVFLLSEITRGAALTSADVLRRGRTIPRYADLHAAIRKESTELARLAQGAANSEAIARARSSRETAERELLELARGLMGSGDARLDSDLRALSALVTDDDALVAYRRYPRSRFEPGGATEPKSTESMCAFVVRAGEHLVRVELGAIEPIEHAVAAWRASIDAGGGVSRGIGVVGPNDTSTASDAAGDEVRRMVFDPLREALAGAEHLVVALDDVLHLVPFDALPAEATGASPARGDRRELLGSRWRIEVRSTLTEMLSENEPAARAVGLVALGDVDYDQDGTPGAPERSDTDREPSAGIHETAGILRGGAWHSGFARLPATGVEVRGIAAMYEQVFGGDADLHVLEHEAASAENLGSLAPPARFLHIATHGWFAPESIQSWSDPEPLDKQSGLGLRVRGEAQVKGMSPMLLCGLALAGANSPENAVGRVPGLITAEELSTLDLSNCELAVLSACDTNVGERRAGQGVASLQKALQMAGARSVITSLWKVPDEATKELMLDFYRRLWVEKKPKHQALWEAKTKLREAQNERGEPKYTTRDWAAWVLTGEQE